MDASSHSASASGEYTEEESHKNTETHKTILVSSRYIFPQGRIDFSVGSAVVDNVQPSPAFLDAIQSALAKSSHDEQRAGLYDVFDKFGNVFRTQLYMGGVLSAHTSETFSRSVRNYL